MRHLVLFFLIFYNSTSIAAITNERPRVLIDNAITNSLQKQAVDNTQEWQRLESWCDNYLGKKLNSGYRGEQWYQAVLNYGMCFQATANQTYGNEGVTYLTALIDDHLTIGDNTGGDNRFANDDGNGNGYVSRFVGTGTVIGRDWLDGASDLNQGLIDRIGERVKYWLESYLLADPKQSVYAINDPNDNFFSGHFSFFTLASISLFGDKNYNPEWRTQADTMWNTFAKPNIVNHLKGGDWQEGWNYAPLAIRGQLFYMHALNLASDPLPNFNDIGWVEELIHSHIHGLSPDRTSFHNNGSWTGNTKGDPRRATMLLLSQMTNDQELKKRAAWYNSIITTGSAPWEDFLWKESSTPITPKSSYMGALSYLIEGTSRVFSRGDEWSNTTTTWVEFAAPPTGSVAQDEMNVGEFKILSRGEKLIVDSDTYEYSSEYGNLLFVAGSHTYAPAQEWWRDGVKISSYENTNEYTYARATNLENAYDGKAGDSPSLKNYNRSFLYIRPDYIIIYDKLTPSNPTINTVYSQVHFQGNPVISGSKANSIVGKAKVFMDVRGHNVSMNATDVSGSIVGSVSRVRITPISTAPEYNLIHIFETADNFKANMDTVTNFSGNGCIGITIGSKTAIFADDPDISFSNSIAGTHTIVNLSPSTLYTITTEGANTFTTTTTSSKAGIVTINLSNPGVTTTHLNAGSQEEAPTELKAPVILKIN